MADSKIRLIFGSFRHLYNFQHASGESGNLLNVWIILDMKNKVEYSDEQNYKEHEHMVET